MKHPIQRTDLPDDVARVWSADPEQQDLYKTYLLVHGRPRGPMSTLTRDLRLHTEPKHRGERPA